MKVRKWSVYRANPDPVIGSEQGKARPVLVIIENEINQMLPIVNVLPLTSRKPGRRIYPNEVLVPANLCGLSQDSIIPCHQIRTLDKQRLGFEYGQVSNPEKREETLDALCFQIGIERVSGL